MFNAFLGFRGQSAVMWFKKKKIDYFITAYLWTTLTPKGMRTLKSNLKCMNVIALNQTVAFKKNKIN